MKLKIEIYNGMIAGSSKTPVEIILLTRLPRGKREETKVTIIRNEGGNAVIEPVDIKQYYKDILRQHYVYKFRPIP